MHLLPSLASHPPLTHPNPAQPQQKKINIQYIHSYSNLTPIPIHHQQSITQSNQINPCTHTQLDQHTLKTGSKCNNDSNYPQMQYSTFKSIIASWPAHREPSRPRTHPVRRRGWCRRLYSRDDISHCCIL